MSNILLALLCIVASLLAYFYYKIKKIHETWSSRGIPHEKPVFFFGNSLRTIFRYANQGERYKEVCDQFPDAPFIGFYEFLRPQLLVKDSEIIEKILIKDFGHFVDHGFEMDENKNPLDISLFTMTGKKWKALRNKLTPIFTTGKLKIMYDQMNGIGQNMDKLLEKEMKCLELREITGRFAMDVISSFAFGFDAGNLANPDSEFRRMGKKSFEMDMIQLMKFFLLMSCPDLAKKLGIGFTQPDVQKYFVNIIRDTIEYRKKNNAKRNDFVDLMIQIKEKGSVEITTKDPGDDYLGIDEHYVTDSFDLTEDLIVGNSFVFLTAGFEATATSMTWACYELAQNEKIQDRLRQEIVEKVKEHGGLSFDAVKDMEYLEMTMKETMRKYPPAQALFRVCTKEYSLPGGQTIKKGDTVLIPLLSVHHCPEYYPEPSKFDPERFGPDASLKPCVYLPFGDGPRMCIGNMNKQVSYSVLLKEICDKFPDAPFVGFYEFTRPRLLVKDSELVEKVLIKDFQHFADHGFEMDETKDPLDITLFNMSGKKWKAYRNKLSPVFTTGKLKIMHEQMNAIGESMDKWLDEQDLTGLELRDIMGRFAMDVISSFAFGFDAGSIANPDSEFRRVGKKSVEITKTQMAKFIFMACCPDLSKKLCLGFSRADVRDYFVNIVKDTMKYRTENNVRRNDILDLLLQIKQKGSVEITTKDPGDDYLGIDEHYVTDSFELTDNLIIGTAFGFLTAGFEATAISMIWACYELTQNEQIQDRLRQEISEKVEKHGKLDFEALKEMQYLEMCLKETLRKYPPVGGLLRVCTKEYEFPGGYLVKKGDSVMIPVHAIQHNPDYYPDPEKFDPERFAPDVSQRPCTFLPFGEGPRVCLAMRFAMLQIKFGLAKILTSYKLKLSTKTELPIVHSRKAIFTSPEKPIYFDLIKC